MDEEGMKDYVYVMDDSPYGRKIGRSLEPEKRLKAIRGCNPRNVKIIYTYQLDNRDDGEKLEKKLHKEFAEKRIRNEWFNINKNDLTEIENICDDFYSDYTTYEYLDEWFEDANKSDLLKKYYAPFKMPKVHKIDAQNQKIIYCDNLWNKIFDKYFGAKAKESYKYLQKKYQILKDAGSSYRYDVVSIWESDFYIFENAGLKWDKELEQYLHFFGAYDWYTRKDGFELLNMWNIYNGIPFTVNSSNEKRYGNNIESTIYEGCDAFVDIALKNILHDKKVRFTKDFIHPTHIFLKNYINNFAMKNYETGIRNTAKVNIQKCDGYKYLPYLKHQHYISGNNKFCLDEMSELHRQFLIEGFKKIYDIDFVKIISELNVSDEALQGLSDTDNQS